MNNLRVRKLLRRLSDVRLCKRLDDAGLGTPGKIRRASDEDILAVEGIGPDMLKKIREAFPKV